MLMCLDKFYIKITIFILILNISNLCLGHINPIPIADGKLIYNQELKNNFKFNLTFLGNNNISLQDIGVEYFNVGEDDSSTIFLKILKKNTGEIILNTDTLIKEIYFQTIFINTKIQLFPNIDYEIIIGSRNKNNDDKIHLFSPNIIPYFCKEYPVKVNEIYKESNENPDIRSSICPYITLGIGSQTGIDFIAEKTILKYPSDSKAESYSTIFEAIKENILITKIGLNYLDIGNDSVASLNFYIKNKNDNLIFTLDTIISNVFKKKFDLNCNIHLNKNEKYEIGIKNLNPKDTDNIILAYSTKTLPYYDNLNLTNVLEFKKNNITDTTGISFYLGYKLINLSLDIIKNNLFKIEKNSGKVFFYFNDESMNGKKIELLDTSGKIIASEIILEQKVEITDNLFNENNIYLLKDIYNTFVTKFYLK